MLRHFGRVVDLGCEESARLISGSTRIDLDSLSEIAVLEQLFDHVLPGGVIVFDDYGWKMFHKQKEAEDDFMRRHDHEILEAAPAAAGNNC